MVHEGGVADGNDRDRRLPQIRCEPRSEEREIATPRAADKYRTAGIDDTDVDQMRPHRRDVVEFDLTGSPPIGPEPIGTEPRRTSIVDLDHAEPGRRPRRSNRIPLVPIGGRRTAVHEEHRRARTRAVLQGAVLYLAAVFLIVNLIVDVLYAVLDPRARLE